MAAPKAATTTTGTQKDAKPPAGAFPPFDPSTFGPQLIWLALTFAVLYLTLQRSLLPRIGDVIEARQEGIARDLKQAEALKIETEKALADYEKALAEAKANASDIAKSTRAAITAEVEGQRARTEADLMKQLSAAEGRIAESKARAMATVTDVAADTVSAIVTKLTGSAVDKAEAARAVAAAAAQRT
jgi:F-type H+-transporting ATPase subunit b